MLLVYRWIKNVGLLLGLLILISCVVMVEKKYIKQVCKEISITILPIEDQQFIEEASILAYLKANNPIGLYNTPIQQIKSKDIENIIKTHNFVKLCSVYKTWKGSLKINIVPKHILARIIGKSEPHRYLDDQGELLFLSANHTPRVLVLDSKKLYKLGNSILDFPWGQSIINMLQLVSKDAFWKAQIIHMSLDDNDELIISTQFSRHKIFFGKPKDIEQKMEKLKLFYTAILPYKGWDAYKKVILKFDNQIVCE